MTLYKPHCPLLDVTVLTLISEHTFVQGTYAPTLFSV